jgi:hypothetical protein
VAQQKHRLAAIASREIDLQVIAKIKGAVKLAVST